MTTTVWTMVEGALGALTGPLRLLGVGIAAWTLKGAVILALAAAVALLLRDRSAALRHLVWMVALTALLALPALEGVVPSWRVAPALLAPLAGSTLRAPLERIPGPPVVEGTSRVESSPPVFDVRAEPGRASVPAVAAGGVSPERVGSPPSPPLPGSASAHVTVPSGAVSSRAASSPAIAPGKASASGSAPATGSNELVPASGPGTLPVVLLGAWLLGAAALLGRLAVGAARAGTLASRGQLVREPRVLRLARQASSRLGLARRTTLVWSHEVPVPLTFGANRPVLLLPRAARHWGDERLRHVLLHELAHVERRDWTWGLVAEVTRALHWMNPLAWLAVGRVRSERERACDDRVLRIGCRPSAYASDLLDVASDLAPAWRPGAGAVPMARRQELGGRLRAILDPGRRREGAGRAAVVVAVLTAGAVALPVAALAPAEGSGGVELPSLADRPSAGPALAALPAAASAGFQVAGGQLCAFRSDGRRSTSINATEDRTTLHWSSDDCDVEVDVRGDVEFTADDSGITRVPDGARFEIEERADGNSRRLLAVNGPGDVPVFTYWRDGREQPFEPEGREWLAAILPELFRNTTINAEQRVRRILDRDGVPGVLREIDRMESDHVIGTYLDHLVAMVELDESVVRGILDVAARRLDSDHYLARVLQTLGRRDALTPGVHRAFLDAVAEIDSDHYTRETLTVLLDRPDLSTETRRTILDTAARQIDSDHYLSEILVRLIERGELDRVGREAFLSALRSVESDHYTHQVLSAFLDRGPLAPGELANVIDLLEEVDSDHYRSTLLGRVARERELTGEALEAWGRAVEGLDSDHYAHQTLSELLDRDDVGDREVAIVLRLAGSIESDHYLSELLVEVARRHPLEGDLRDRWLSVASGIDSRHYRERVMAALGGRGSA